MTLLQALALQSAIERSVQRTLRRLEYRRAPSFSNVDVATEAMRRDRVRPEFIELEQQQLFELLQDCAKSEMRRKWGGA